MKVHQIPHARIETTRSRFIQILNHCSMSRKITPLCFFISNLYTLDKKSPSKWLLSAWVKNHQVSYVIFGTTIQFFLNLCITLQRHERKLFCTFLVETVHDLDKRSPSRCKISDFWLLTFLTFDCFCWKYIEIFAERYRLVMSHCSEDWCKIWRKTDLLFQVMTKIWWILTWALKSLKNLHFHWFLLCKVFNVWPKKVQRSYLSWHWRVMQNLKKNWLVAWKMTWGILQIFTRALESVKIGTLMGSFCPK